MKTHATNLAELRQEYELELARCNRLLRTAEIKLETLAEIEATLRAGQSWKEHACPDPGQEVEVDTELENNLARGEVLGLLRLKPLLSFSGTSILNALPHLTAARIISALTAAEAAGEITAIHGSLLDAVLYRIKASPDEPAERSGEPSRGVCALQSDPIPASPHDAAERSDSAVLADRPLRSVPMMERVVPRFDNAINHFQTEDYPPEVPDGVVS